MKKLLLFIKSILYKLGVDISFVRKEEERSAIELNEVDASNENWSDEERSKLYLSKEVIKRYQETVSFLEEHAIDLSGKSIIDVGCGNGMLLKFIADNYNISSQTGMEYARAATEVAAKLNPAAEYIVHDINHPFPKRYDAVICTEVLEHILHPAKAFRNMLALVRKGGVMLITVPNGRYDTFTGHINFWSPESWDAFISENTDGLRYSTGKIEKTLVYAIIHKPE